MRSANNNPIYFPVDMFMLLYPVFLLGSTNISLFSILLSLTNSFKCILLFKLFFLFVGLTAKVIDRTNNMTDVNLAFYDFSNILKPKVQC